MTTSDLVAALAGVTSALDALGVRYFVGGSTASSAHGMARSTLDVDIVAELAPAHVDELVARLHPAYYVPVERLRAASDPLDLDYLARWAGTLAVDDLLARALAAAGRQGP